VAFIKYILFQGETSSTFAPVGSNIDESYVAGVMLLDKLGLSASLGLKLVVRQTFYGFWFALVNEKLEPTPNYWVALMYSRLVGKTVLKVDVKGVDGDKVRVYGHCTKPGAGRLPNGTITLYAMNLDKEPVKLKLGGMLAQSQIYEYLLTPGDMYDLQSTSIRLNGNTIKMVDENTLPEFVGNSLPAGLSFTLPPYTFAFYVIGWPKGGPVAACKP
jgi:heparanase 1